MGYVRVFISESPLSPAEGLKIFQKLARPALEEAIKAGIVDSYWLVQNGDKGFKSTRDCG